MIPIQIHPTTRTGERPLGQRHLLPMSTGGTSLGRIGRIHSRKLTPGTLSLVREKREELRPRRITDASIHAPVRVHFVDRNVFYEDSSILIDDLSGFLMSKVISFESDSFMDLRHFLFDFPSFRRSFLLKFQFPLRLRESFCAFLKKLWVLNRSSIGKKGERLYSHINSDRNRIGWKNFIGNIIARQHQPPFSSGGFENGAGFDLSLDRTMKDNANRSNLGKPESFPCQGASGFPLRKSQRRILPFSLESWASRLFAVFNSSEKGLKSQIHPNGNILKYLRMNLSEIRTMRFKIRKCLYLVIQRFRNTVVPIRHLSMI